MLCNVGYFHILSPIFPSPQKEKNKKKIPRITEIISNIKHFVGKAEKIEKSITEKSTACLIYFF